MTTTALENYGSAGRRMSRLLFFFKSAQCITVWVTSDIGEQFLCSCVYASNFAVDRQHLWTEMAYIKTQYALPGVSWIVMDDFNETLVSSKHSRGTISNANLRGMEALQSAVAT